MPRPWRGAAATLPYPMLTLLRRLVIRSPGIALSIGLSVLALGAVMMVRYFRTEKGPEFVTAPTVIGDIEATVLATGTIQAYKQVSVGAQASGQLKTLHVALGDEVKSGAL